MIQDNIDYDKFKEENASSIRSRRRKGSRSNSTSKRGLRSIKFPSFIKEIFSNKNLTEKILFTIFIIAIYRFMASIPLPGIDMNAYQQAFGQSNASDANYFFTIFTGGLLETPSIVGLGIAAYINASIMMQLLTPVIPKLSELSKEGARGSQLINQYTRYLTLPLSFIYSVVYLIFLSQRNLNDPSGLGIEDSNGLFLVPRADGSDFPAVSKLIFMALILTAGSMLIMWLAEAITENGIGNGSSLIISIGIISSLPTLVKSDFQNLDVKGAIEELLSGNIEALTSTSIIVLISVLLGFIAMIAFIVFINESARKIQIHYARQTSESAAGQESTLPIKLTITGVLPIIFASALLSVPQLIVTVLQTRIEDSSFIDSLEGSFLFAANDQIVNVDDVYYGIFYFILIVVFGMFYAFITLKPSDTAENLQKSSAFIPGVRPGKSTENYISKVLLRIGFAGGIFLALIALIPFISRNFITYITPNNINMFVLSGIGGTSILIVVSVVLETMRQIKALKVTKSYQQFT